MFLLLGVGNLCTSLFLTSYSLILYTGGYAYIFVSLCYSGNNDSSILLRRNNHESNMGLYSSVCVDFLDL
jgi:hypothetical protein